MTRIRMAVLTALLTLSGWAGPIPLHAGTAMRTVILADLTRQAEEVAISSRHLTLIHFEMGDVSMVAVGDPSFVTVTVRGPDVLLKASASSGSTNAFIWQGSHYTQWLLVVRTDHKDARLIVVKEAPPTHREEAFPALSSSQGTTTSNRHLGATPADVSSVDGSVGGESPAQTSPPPTPSKSSPEAGAASDMCGNAGQIERFVTTLSVRQRDLFGAFLARPTLTRLRALLLDLSPSQRCGLVALLSATGLPGLGLGGLIPIPIQPGAIPEVRSGEPVGGPGPQDANPHPPSPPAPPKSIDSPRN